MIQILRRIVGLILFVMRERSRSYVTNKQKRDE